MRTAIVHYWLTGMRGGEKVLEALCRLLPDARIFTLFYEPERVSPLIRSRVVKTSFLNPLRAHYRSLLPLMPIALEQFDLRGYDLVISSESGPAKGVVTRSDTRHICYCESPMRYLWDLYPDHQHDWIHSPVRKAVFALASHYLRLWDYASAARVDQFVANSHNVRRRIWKTYRRDAEVIHPPMDALSFQWRPAGSYYLVVSELVPYKRVADAVHCFASRSFAGNGRQLKVVGDGPEYKALRAIANGNIEFCGRVTDSDLRDLYSRARAVVMPGEEDFGLVPLEALASGKAVIALGKGGVLETVPTHSPRAGFFFDNPGPSQLAAAVEEFEVAEPSIEPSALQQIPLQFSEERFAEQMRRLIEAGGDAEESGYHELSAAASSSNSTTRLR